MTSPLASLQPAIELRDVVKVYEGGVRALDGVDLVVEEGEFVAITGPSGCGKSTLLHLVAALDTPTSGSVLVEGRDLDRVHDMSRFRREQVGLVFQLHNLLPQVSVRANIEVAMFGSRRSARGRRDRALELVQEMDLEGREDRLPTRLSGGERQRVAIARALANEPRLLLADEPTGNLDAASVDRMIGVFHQLHASGVTILLVTHDHSVAQAAQRTVYMRDGRIVEGVDAR
ncbi:MAG TPA: ABC transporter ATP-binding protein [Acidimicrobiales bacterium]|nr:ABC transporter ATP-binding protein [Acidimicrobiales bacterium]HLN43055.1 ABC transporter ATP-binding protein [Acidimicrobiales bacterium]